MAGNSMQDIKRRIKSVTSTEHITNAMKLVSAAKFRKAKAAFDKGDKYFDFITDSIMEILFESDEVPNTYLLGNREIKTTLYIVITSSRGLCGSFNANVLKEAQAEIDRDWEEPLIIPIGTKAKEYFSHRGYNIVEEHTGAVEEMTFEEAQEIGERVVDLYNAQKIDEIVIIYTSFKSSLEQVVKNFTVLPFDVEMEKKLKQVEFVAGATRSMEYEPSVPEIFNFLVPKYVEIQLYNAVVESAVCEHAARRMAMENATDSAREMLEDLSLFYNRARQSAITGEITEIVAGSEAQK